MFWQLSYLCEISLFSSAEPESSSLRVDASVIFQDVRSHRGIFTASFVRVLAYIASALYVEHLLALHGFALRSPSHVVLRISKTAARFFFWYGFFLSMSFLSIVCRRFWKEFLGYFGMGFFWVYDGGNMIPLDFHSLRHWRVLCCEWRLWILARLFSGFVYVLRSIENSGWSFLAALHFYSEH